jgi:hypothetical protein
MMSGWRRTCSDLLWATGNKDGPQMVFPSSVGKILLAPNAGVFTAEMLDFSPSLLNAQKLYSGLLMNVHILNFLRNMHMFLRFNISPCLSR